MKIIYKYKKNILLFIGGGILGLMYYKYIGCTSGACPISSNPYISIVYGAVLAVLSQDSFHFIKSKLKKNKYV